jgi:hypothetical protein
MADQGKPRPIDIALEAKMKMIIDMAIDFAGMTRVLMKGSNAKVFRKLEQLFAELDIVASQEHYDHLNVGFCEWFTQNIRTAEKKLKNGRVKAVGPSSYGHAAKVLDITAKVFVYYCGLPSSDKAKALVPMLHGAIDNQILDHSKQRFPAAGITAGSIAEMDRGEYELLQSLVQQEIKEDFETEICRAQYDDILFLRLNREPVN